MPWRECCKQDERQRRVEVRGERSQDAVEGRLLGSRPPDLLAGSLDASLRQDRRIDCADGACDRIAQFRQPPTCPPIASGEKVKSDGPTYSEVRAVVRLDRLFGQEPAGIHDTPCSRYQIRGFDPECRGRVATAEQADIAGAHQELEKVLDLRRFAISAQPFTQPNRVGSMPAV